MVDTHNIILATDSYKLNHWMQYPKDTEGVYSYLESRNGAVFPYTTFFGLQYILREYLEGVRVTEAVINEARDQLAGNHGMKTNYMRVRSYPFTPEVDEFVSKHELIFVVEMNRDGQLHQLLSLANPEAATRLHSVAYGDGMPASAKWVREGILAKSEKNTSAPDNFPLETLVVNLTNYLPAIRRKMRNSRSKVHFVFSHAVLTYNDNRLVTY